MGNNRTECIEICKMVKLVIHTHPECICFLKTGSDPFFRVEPVKLHYAPPSRFNSAALRSTPQR